jgi:hypothetical protein
LLMMMMMIVGRPAHGRTSFIIYTRQRKVRNNRWQSDIHLFFFSYSVNHQSMSCT